MTSTSREADAEVRTDIIAAFERDGVDPFGIDVEVSEGEVLLTGVVPSHSERLRAHDLARSCAGGRSLLDHLVVRPLGSDWHVTPDELASGVARTLRDTKVLHTGVGFSITDRLVTLTGSVPDFRTRAILRHLVQNTPGVHFVDNQIRVAGEETS